MSAPKYRQDIKGHLAEVIDECVHSIRGQLQDPECMHFCLEVEDTDAFDEYKDILTLSEMRRAFKTARQPAVPA